MQALQHCIWEHVEFHNQLINGAIIHTHLASTCPEPMKSPGAYPDPKQHSMQGEGRISNVVVSGLVH